VSTELTRAWAKLDLWQTHTADITDGALEVRRVPFGYAWTVYLALPIPVKRSGFNRRARTVKRAVDHTILDQRSMAGLSFVHR
jgi:hypothetical protein